MLYFRLHLRGGEGETPQVYERCRSWRVISCRPEYSPTQPGWCEHTRLRSKVTEEPGQVKAVTISLQRGV